MPLSVFLLRSLPGVSQTVQCAPLPKDPHFLLMRLHLRCAVRFESKDFACYQCRTSHWTSFAVYKRCTFDSNLRLWRLRRHALAGLSYAPITSGVPRYETPHGFARNYKALYHVRNVVSVTVEFLLQIFNLTARCFLHWLLLLKTAFLTPNPSFTNNIWRILQC